MTKIQKCEWCKAPNAQNDTVEHGVICDSCYPETFDYDAYKEVKTKGWRHVIENSSMAELVERYDDVAAGWGCCAVGEVLGFPKPAAAFDTVEQVPRIHQAGAAFSAAIGTGDKARALAALEKIQSYGPSLQAIHKAKRGR